ncbi:prepilin-type N-terminal cleavage/methylation domain-containing protein [Eubacteriaceae bacterium ES2]|nr:prepilin-type N-terminal cleavage/methylation domain-containing protein [Eubacteriaceae bacterium ES2]
MNKQKCSDKGYTLIEGIVAISLLSVGMVLVFSFLGLLLQTQMRSSIVFQEAKEINSLCDELKYELGTQAQPSQDKINHFLQVRYPNYQLVGIRAAGAGNYWIIEIVDRRMPENHFFINYYGV